MPVVELAGLYLYSKMCHGYCLGELLLLLLLHPVGGSGELVAWRCGNGGDGDDGSFERVC